MLQDQVSFENGIVSQGWMERNLTKININVIAHFGPVYDYELEIRHDSIDKDSIQDLVHACVVVKGRLGITSTLQCTCPAALDDLDDLDDVEPSPQCAGEHTNAIDCKGRRWSGVKVGECIKTLFPGTDVPLSAAQSKNFIYSFGNIRDFIVSLAAINELDSHAKEITSCCGRCVKKICSAVANPLTRGKTSLLPMACVRESAVRLNAEQRQILRGLKFNLEALQGPPGTGKTAFIHVAALSLSAQNSDGVTMVACVQNQVIPIVLNPQPD